MTPVTLDEKSPPLITDQVAPAQGARRGADGGDARRRHKGEPVAGRGGRHAGRSGHRDIDGPRRRGRGTYAPRFCAAETTAGSLRRRRRGAEQLTVVAPVKLLPVIVTEKPPPLEPLPALSDATAGAAWKPNKSAAEVDDVADAGAARRTVMSTVAACVGRKGDRGDLRVRIDREAGGRAGAEENGRCRGETGPRDDDRVAPEDRADRGADRRQHRDRHKREPVVGRGRRVSARGGRRSRPPCPPIRSGPWR